MKDKLMTILIAVVIIEILLLTLGSVFAMLGMMGFNTGCVYRYDLNNGSSTASDTFTRNVSIRADGNYSSNVGTVAGVKTIVKDPTSYGKWTNANITLVANQSVDINIDGIVSLCTSYLPVNNIGSDQNVRSNGTPISIPRVEDSTTAPITLVFDARTKDWRNILELYTGDIVEVILKDNRSSGSALSTGSINQVVETNIFTGQSFSADCSEGKQSYSPICGRWSMWNGGQSYVSSCTTSYGATSICGAHCCKTWAGSCWDWAAGGSPCYNSCWNNSVGSGSLPVPYRENMSLTTPQGTNISNLSSQQCIAAAACNANPAACISACTADPQCNTECNVTTCQSVCTACGTSYTSCTGACNAKYTACASSCATDKPCIRACNDQDAACASSCATANSTCLNGSADVASCKNSCATNSPVCLQNCQSSSINICKVNCQSAAICNNVQCSPNDLQSKACKALQNDGSSFNNNIKNYKYWFSARDAGGLRQRLNATNATAGTDNDGVLAIIQNPALDFSPDQYTGRKLYSSQYSNNADTAVKYLQYKFYGADHTNYTGGYVFQVKHTKCRRVKGEVITDSYANRGQVLYVVSNSNPNTDQNAASKSKPLPTPKSGKTTIVTGNTGDLWLKIDNNSTDYKDSTGQYRVTLSYNVGRTTFNDKVLTPLLTMIKQRVNIAGMQIFQNLLCLKQDANGKYIHDTISGSCSNFFNYIRAMLTLYIMTYGIMFLAGIVKASYQDIVIRVVKVGLVAGLLSGQTFLWFNDTIFNFIIGFTDQIIANFGGFQNISSANNANNAAGPFMFLNTIFTKIFFTQTFAIQLMAIMGIGMIGIIYFIIVCAAVIILIIVGLRAVAVYIIAMVATAFLISLTPIFLTFMLFEQTYYLFEGWYKALFRFMMEPVILMIGIIVLTQIFTLYLDNVLSYSACWKCSLSFYIPFSGLLPFPGLENIPLFCIYWFGPWGLDNSGVMGQLGMDLSDMLGLIIIAFALYGYADLAASIASSLTSASSGSGSSISTGVGMAKSMGQSALRRVGLDDQTQGRLKQEQARGRTASRDALKQHEQSIIGQEKKLGIYESDTSKALKRGKGNLKDAAIGIKDSARGMSDDLGITDRDYAQEARKKAEKVLKNPEVQEKLAAHYEAQAQEAAAQHGQEVDRLHSSSKTSSNKSSKSSTSTTSSRSINYGTSYTSTSTSTYTTTQPDTSNEIAKGSREDLSYTIESTNTPTTSSTYATTQPDTSNEIAKGSREDLSNSTKAEIKPEVRNAYDDDQDSYSNRYSSPAANEYRARQAELEKQNITSDTNSPNKVEEDLDPMGKYMSAPNTKATPEEEEKVFGTKEEREEKINSDSEASAPLSNTTKANKQKPQEPELTSAQEMMAKFKAEEAEKQWERQQELRADPEAFREKEAQARNDDITRAGEAVKERDARQAAARAEAEANPNKPEPETEAQKAHRLNKPSWKE